MCVLRCDDRVRKRNHSWQRIPSSQHRKGSMANQHKEKVSCVLGTTFATEIFSRLYNIMQRSENSSLICRPRAQHLNIFDLQVSTMSCVWFFLSHKSHWPVGHCSNPWQKSSIHIQVFKDWDVLIAQRYPLRSSDQLLCDRTIARDRDYYHQCAPGCAPGTYSMK
jgi:hypothetical protein